MKSNQKAHQSPVNQFNYKLKSIQRRIWAQQFVILAWISAAMVVFLDYIPASAQNAGFGDAIDKIKGNAIITNAGTEAVDLFSFPFLIGGAFILLIVLFAIIFGASQMLSGRDWISPLIALVGMFAIILLGGGIYVYVANSGLFG